MFCLPCHDLLIAGEARGARESRRSPLLILPVPESGSDPEESLTWSFRACFQLKLLAVIKEIIHKRM